MGKASEPPKCKACGKAHWGTCMDHENRGYLSSRAEPAPAPVRAQRIAKAEEVIGTTKPGKGGAPKRASKPARTRPVATGRKSGGRKLSVSTPAATGIELGDSAPGATPTPDLKSGRRTPVPDAGAAAAPPAAAPPQQAGETAAPEPKRRGRPKTVDDRKAYLAQKARERRARNKPTT